MIPLFVISQVLWNHLCFSYLIHFSFEFFTSELTLFKHLLRLLVVINISRSVLISCEVFFLLLLLLPIFLVPSFAYPLESLFLILISMILKLSILNKVFNQNLWLVLEQEALLWFFVSLVFLLSFFLFLFIL